MGNHYPIMLGLSGKKVLAVGGGKVAERRITGLIKSGAEIKVISPEITPVLKDAAEAGKIQWLQRSFLEKDTEDALLIFAVTDDHDVNLNIKKAAGKHQLVTLADNPDESDFHVPAAVERGRLCIAVSTGGASPSLAKDIRDQLYKQYNQKYEEYLHFLFTARRWILKEVQSPSLKKELLASLAKGEFLDSKNRDEEFRSLYKKLQEQGL